MSRQTDQLMGLEVMEADPTDAANELASRQRAEFEVGRAKARLTALQDMRRTVGYKIVQEALQVEVDDSFSNMARTDNPTVLARYSGMHYATVMAARYVELEISRLSAFLAGALK